MHCKDDEHAFPKKQDFCTHLGHEEFGAHARHYVCRRCGALKYVQLGHGETRIIPASEAMQCIIHWNLIREEHVCRSGWRGVVVEETHSSEIIEEDLSCLDGYQYV